MDQSSFEQVYRQYSPLVYANIFKIIRQQELAEDLLQEVFVSLWENRFRIDPAKSVGGWLFVVSYNKSLSFLNKKVKESIVLVENYDAFDSLKSEDLIAEDSYQEQIAVIEEAAALLSPRVKEVFTLSRFEGHSVDEVALKMNLSASAVKDYLKQSNKVIRNYVKHKYVASPAMVMLLAYLNS